MNGFADGDMAGECYRKTVSAVVVTYWTGPALGECLEALIRQPEVCQILVVDNGNSCETRVWLKEFCAQDSRLLVIDPGRNLGFSSGCNLGASYASGEFIALVNPDLIIPEGGIAAFLEVFRDVPGVWLCGGRLEHPDGREQRGGRRHILSPWRAFVELTRLDRIFPETSLFSRLHLYEAGDCLDTHEVPTVSGAFMIIPRRLYQRLGGFDDNMFMHFEDADLCIRIRKLGGKVMYCGNISVKHYLGTSDASRLFIEWHKTRSTSYYFYKHFFYDYPALLLLATSVALWCRFFVLAPVLLVRDAPGILRRLRHRRWGRGSGILVSGLNGGGGDIKATPRIN